MKLTVPTGGLFVPLAVSCTVTVQLSGLFAGVEGGQSNVVCVDRAMTWTMSVPLLARKSVVEGKRVVAGRVQMAELSAISTSGSAVMMVGVGWRGQWMKV